MKNLNKKKLIILLITLFTISVNSVSAKIFGHDCGYTIDTSGGDCVVKYHETAYYFWIPVNTDYEVGCDWGGAFQLCDS